MAKRERARANGEAAGGDAAPQDKTPRSSTTEWVKSIVIALALFLFLRTFVIQTFVIISGSMEKTLLVGDMLVLNRASLGSRIPLIGLHIPGYSHPRWRVAPCSHSPCSHSNPRPPPPPSR